MKIYSQKLHERFLERARQDIGAASVSHPVFTDMKEPLSDGDIILSGGRDTHGRVVLYPPARVVIYEDGSRAFVLPAAVEDIPYHSVQEELYSRAKNFLPGCFSACIRADAQELKIISVSPEMQEAAFATLLSITSLWQQHVRIAAHLPLGVADMCSRAGGVVELKPRSQTFARERLPFLLTVPNTTPHMVSLGDGTVAGWVVVVENNTLFAREQCDIIHRYWTSEEAT